VVKEKKVLEASVDKGAPHGEKYIFHGESDEHPDKEPGDVVIVVNEQPHKLFKRKGADLLIEKEITLLEALTGCDFPIEFLDGSKFRIKSAPGQVIKPDSLMTIEDKGLPFHKNPYKFGNLFVLFHIKFPDTLEQSSISVVSNCLSSQKKNKTDVDMDVAETVTLQPYKEEHKNSHVQGGTKGNDSDEEEGDGHPHGGQRV
jgi:DnaJ homolog subfamily A member 2